MNGRKKAEDFLLEIGVSKDRLGESDWDLRELDLTGFDLSHSRIDDATFQRCNLTNTRFHHAVGSGAIFDDVKKFSNSSFRYADLKHCSFQRSNLFSTNWTHAELHHCRFDEVDDVYNSLWLEATLYGSTLPPIFQPALNDITGFVDTILKTPKVIPSIHPNASLVKLSQTHLKNARLLGAMWGEMTGTCFALYYPKLTYLLRPQSTRAEIIKTMRTWKSDLL